MGMRSIWGRVLIHRTLTEPTFWLNPHAICSTCLGKLLYLSGKIALLGETLGSTWGDPKTAMAPQDEDVMLEVSSDNFRRG